MSTSEAILHSELSNNILHLTINRPERRNSLNNDLIVALKQAFSDASQNPEVRLIVLGATGEKAFCAGADLNPNAGTFGFDYAQPNVLYADLLRTAKACTVPIIGRINGFCLAGGMGLLAICDMAVAATEAKFGLPEVKVGVFPMQVAALMQSMLPPRKFAELCLTGDMLSADEALAVGLINYVVPMDELDDKVSWLAERVVKNSPTAIRRGKYALHAAEGMTFEQSIAFMEGQVGLMPLTEDAKEGLAAFAEKRPPEWTGK